MMAIRTLLIAPLTGSQAFSLAGDLAGQGTSQIPWQVQIARPLTVTIDLQEPACCASLPASASGGSSLHRDRVDLDEELGPGQPGHADERVGGLVVPE